MKKRHELPAFKKLNKTFDVEKILEVMRTMPVKDDLKEKGEYGDIVGGKCACLQKTNLMLLRI